MCVVDYILMGFWLALTAGSLFVAVRRKEWGIVAMLLLGFWFVPVVPAAAWMLLEPRGR